MRLSPETTCIINIIFKNVVLNRGTIKQRNKTIVCIEDSLEPLGDIKNICKVSFTFRVAKVQILLIEAVV
jgi:hypothetical protein